MRATTARRVAFRALPVAMMLSPALAHAQAEVAVQIGWQPGSKPTSVEFSTGSQESRPFKDQGSHFLGRRPKAQLTAKHDFVIRWSDFAVTLRVRPRASGAPLDPELFRIKKPNTAMLCNNSDVQTLRNQASVANKDNYLSTMLQVMALLRRQNTVCSPGNAVTLAALMLRLNQNIAAEDMSIIFDLSPDVVSLYRRVHQNSPYANSQLAAANAGIQTYLVSGALAELARLEQGEDLSSLNTYFSLMIAASADGDFNAALAGRGVKSADLRRRRPDSPVRWVAAGPKDFVVKPAATGATIARDDAVIAASDLMRDADSGVPDKPMSEQAIANDVTKDPAELLSDPGETEVRDTATQIERADTPLTDVLTSPDPARAVEIDVTKDVSTLEDTATGTDGPG